MAVHKRKKLTRYRGSKTHGGGSMKKRRGAGHRGGRGMAGGGKRADQNKPTILKLYGNDYFGKHGFKNKTTKQIKTITLADLCTKIESFVAVGKAQKKGDVYTLNLSDVGFNKVLGSGKLTKKFKITADYISKKAAEKIEAVGGKAEALNSAEEKWEDVPAEE